MNKKKVLLTGGSGFIGRNLLESSLSKKYDILAPKSSQLNLLDEQCVEDYFEAHSVDYVIHSACRPGHRGVSKIEGLFYSNTRMFTTLAKHHDRYEKMVVIGSGAIYDNRYYKPKMKEEDYLHHIPSDEHGFSKYVCEKMIESYDNIVDLRVFGIFGKYEEYRVRFLSNLICKALFDLPLSMNQDRYFDFLWVEDLVPVIEFALESKTKFKAYNVTPDHSESLLQLAKSIQELINPSLDIVVKQPGLGSEYSGDNSRLKSELTNWQPVSPQVKIPLLIDWYQSQLPHIQKNELM